MVLRWIVLIYLKECSVKLSEALPVIHTRVHDRSSFGLMGTSVLAIRYMFHAIKSLDPYFCGRCTSI